MTLLVVGLVAAAYVASVVLGFVLPLFLPKVESIEAAFVLGCLVTVVAGEIIARLER